MIYPCGHERTPANSKVNGYHPSGKPKLKCRICRREIEKRAKRKARAKCDELSANILDACTAHL